MVPVITVESQDTSQEIAASQAGTTTTTATEETAAEVAAELATHAARPAISPETATKEAVAVEEEDTGVTHQEEEELATNAGGSVTLLENATKGEEVEEAEVSTIVIAIIVENLGILLRIAHFLTLGQELRLAMDAEKVAISEGIVPIRSKLIKVDSGD